MSKKKDQSIGYYPKYRMSEAEKRDQQARLAQGKPRSPKWRLPVAVACGAVFLVSAGLLIRYYAQIGQAKNATAELRQLYVQEQTAAPDVQAAEETAAPAALAAEVTADPAPAETAVLPEATQAPALLTASAQAATEDFAALWPEGYADNPDLRISDSFQTLRRENRDIVGWLSIEDVLDEPVMQKDNEYYLTHDSSGAKNVTGALFLDESCNLRTLSNNLIIHGHNMKEGAMFGSLKKYKVKDAEFYKAHPYITFNTLYEEARYVIFAVAEVSIQPTGAHYMPFWQYVNFWDQSDFDTFVNSLKGYSHFQTRVDVQPGDRLLTLATCSGSNDEARLLVVARKLRDNEDTIALNQGILSTLAK